MFAAAALEEGVIDPKKKIFSTGALILPNPYDPAHPSIFKDWKAHGWIDMREAIAQSSDEYFYQVGGGYKDQPGLGISRIDRYARAFGFGTTTGITLPGEVAGTIPTPEWKTHVFGEDDPWRIGDTYHTVIGQYGFQVTAMQVARYVSAVANGGTLYTPHLLSGETPQGTSVGINPLYFAIVREGMRLGVTSGDGTSKSLDIPRLHIAGKTGTAQLGTQNQWMNSWAVGFWPYEHPKYAYAIVLEKAPAGTLSGAAPGMRPFFDWLLANKPEYTTMISASIPAITISHPL
jgi:penicillin-binding protein 2